MATVEWQRKGATTALVFEPQHLGVIGLAIGDDQTRPMNSRQVLEQFPRAWAIINGPMFARCASEAPQQAGESQAHYYARLRCTVADYRQRDASEDLELSGRHSDRGITFSVLPTLTGADVYAAPGANVHADAAVAVQCYPTLVYNGTLATLRPDADHVWRCALGARADGRLAFLITRMGMQDLQRECRAFGLEWAGYLDGGGSSDLSARDGVRIGADEYRPVSTWLAVLSPSIPRSIERYARTHPLQTVAIASGAILGSIAVYRVVKSRREQPQSRETR